MQDLIARVVAETGLEKGKAERVAGTVLSLMQSQGSKTAVEKLFAVMPGAKSLAESQSGFADKLAGGMMGGPLAAISRMQSEGLTSNQQTRATAAVIDYCQKNGGARLLRQCIANVPGLSGYL